MTSSWTEGVRPSPRCHGNTDGSAGCRHNRNTYSNKNRSHLRHHDSLAFEFNSILSKKNVEPKNDEQILLVSSYLFSTCTIPTSSPSLPVFPWACGKTQNNCVCSRCFFCALTSPLARRLMLTVHQREWASSCNANFNIGIFWSILENPWTTRTKETKLRYMIQLSMQYIAIANKPLLLHFKSQTS